MIGKKVVILRIKRFARFVWRSVFGRENNSVKRGFRTSKTLGGRLEVGCAGKLFAELLLVPSELIQERVPS